MLTYISVFDLVITTVAQFIAFACCPVAGLPLAYRGWRRPQYRGIVLDTLARLQRVSFDEGGGPLLPTNYCREHCWEEKKVDHESRGRLRAALLMVIDNNWWCAMVHAMNCSSIMLRVGAGCGLNANPVTSTTGDWVVF